MPVDPTLGRPDSVEHAHARPAEEVVRRLESHAERGLSSDEALRRLQIGGSNQLPMPNPPGLISIFVGQFASPLIYILLVAAVVSAVLDEWADTGFIFAVLLLNAVIGTAQEYGAERGAAALRHLVEGQTRVLRDDRVRTVAFVDLTVGDVVLLEAGERVPADCRLLSAVGVDVDESLLTGESLAVAKRTDAAVARDAPLGDRFTMLFAGTTVLHGRARAVITATGNDAEVGRIARSLAVTVSGKAPLLARMERFARGLALGVSAAVVVLGVSSYLQGTPLAEVFQTSVALAVAVIPEGLPVAITVSLAVASRRMARRNVIVRRLVAVESLGSCTFIASDKTGTLTMNELTVQAIALPGVDEPLAVTGSGEPPTGEVVYPASLDESRAANLVQRYAAAGALVNEAVVEEHDGAWEQRGDAVDVALLVLAHKLGIARPALLDARPELDRIPFEPERAYAATLNRTHGRPVATVKGAAERVLPMCSRAATPDGDADLDEAAVTRHLEALAERGMKVIALAEGPIDAGRASLAPNDLHDLTLLGLVGMIDPLRPEARDAVAACHRAGIKVAMVTGDHATTALAIARELGLASGESSVVTGVALREAQEVGDDAVDRLVGPARVFARMEPEQKLVLVSSLTRQGHFVAVTGDGVNDAPALKIAHVGVAMGGAGTDLARDASQLIITDDNFASVVAGVEEGRVAYANVRKVVYLLTSTGLAALLVVLLAFFTGQPLPLLPVQLLWLNLVTSGIQDVALAFEPAEGDELNRPPRPPDEPIFNRLMVERVLLTAIVIAGVGYALYRWLLADDVSLDAARNLLLLQLVLFQNIVVGNARSETRFGLRIPPLRNKVLFFGVLAAQGLHIAALYTPGLSDVLGLEPVSLREWAVLLGLATTAFLVIELHKLWHTTRSRRDDAGAGAEDTPIG